MLRSDVQTALFVPTNKAFAKFFTNPKNESYVKYMLSYYILQTRFDATTPGKFILETCLTQNGTGLNNLRNGKGQNIMLEVTSHVTKTTRLEVLVNNNYPVARALAADNGIIYVMDKVLRPPRTFEVVVQKLELDTFWINMFFTSTLDYFERLNGVTV